MVEYLPLGILFLIAGIALAFADFRIGVRLIVVAGFLQDVLRKATVERSPYWMGLVLLFFAVTFLGAMRTQLQRFWGRPDWQKVRIATLLLVCAVIVQGLFTLLRYGAPAMVGVGLAGYLGPIVALILGVWFGSSPGRVRDVLRLYVFAAALMAFGLVLWQLGDRSPILQSVGVPLFVYEKTRGAILLPSGYFRAPEVASWHCATGCCVSILLASTHRLNALRYAVFGGLAAFFLWGTLVAGRRKGLAAIAIFVVLYALVLVWVRGRLGRYGAAVAAIVLVTYTLSQRIDTGGTFAGQIGSMQEKTEHEGRAYTRLVTSVMSIPDVVKEHGFLGRGLGTLTQGSYYFGANQDWGNVSESGLARLLGELGVVGALLFAVVVVRLVVTVAGKAGALRTAPAAPTNQALGLLAILGTNSVVFVAAHQIFGDPFVYLLLGLFAGAAVGWVDVAALARWRAPRRSPGPAVAGLEAA